MSRPILFALLPAFFLTAVFLPVKSYAQTEDGQSSYGDFLYGGDEEGDEEKEKEKFIWQYDTKYKKGPTTKGMQDILPQGQQYLYFVRKEGIKSNEAVLRLVTPLSISGCANVFPPRVTVRRGGSMLAFKLERGEVALDRSPSYGHFQCHQGSGTASTDIVLNRDELISGHVKTITFQSDASGMDTYEVELSGNTLTLYPKTSMAFKPFTGAERADPLSYNFYPDTMVVLTAPGAPKGADISEEVARLAQSKGLTQASGLKTSSDLYFNDQSGLLAGSLAFGATAYVGKITAAETFQGANGPYQHEKQVDVYARRPGFAD